MNSCAACGSKVGHNDVYCAFCGMYLMKDGIKEKTLTKLIVMVLNASFEGLMKERTRPIEG